MKQEYLHGLVQWRNMGISIRKGNGGYIGFDSRSNVTSSIGVISQRKHRIERLDGDFEPAPPPSAFLFEDTFSTGNLSKWNVANESSTRQWIVGQNTKGSDGSVKTIPSGSSNAAYVSDDNSDNHYTTSTDCFIYFDFTMPEDFAEGSLTLSFEWMCYGENGSGTNNYDYGYILFATTDLELEGGTKIPDLDGEGVYQRITTTNVAANENRGKFNSEDSRSRAGTSAARNAFYPESMTLNSESITGEELWASNVTRRIVFGFTSDGSIQNQPSWTVANVRLKQN